MLSLDQIGKQQAIIAAAKQKQDIALAELAWQQGLAERREQAAGLATKYRVAPYVKDAPQRILDARTELCLVGRCY